MTTKLAYLRSIAFVSMAIAFACSDSPAPSQPGRGTAACNEWQNAYCALVAMCGADSSVCDQVKGITCKSDADAKRCAADLASATCTSSATPGCTLVDIADPAPAKMACESFADAYCGRLDTCQPGSKDTCLQGFKDQLDCSKAIGFSSAFDKCMSEVPNILCSNPTVPSSCKGVLLLTP